MKKIVFASLLLFGLAAATHAQTPAKTNTQKKEAIKPASSVTAAPAAAKKTTSNTKTSTPAKTTSPAKVSAANIGKHKRKHHKAAKKPAKKS